jgi:hypothetical protein
VADHAFESCPGAFDVLGAGSTPTVRQTSLARIPAGFAASAARICWWSSSVSWSAARGFQDGAGGRQVGEFVVEAGEFGGECGDLLAEQSASVDGAGYADGD